MYKKFEEVLFIGPEKDYGGMGSVLEIYANYIPSFKFIASYPSFQSGRKGWENKIYASLFFLQCIFHYIYVLIFDRKIKIVHIHSASNGSFIRKSILTHIGKVLNKKVVLHIHSGNFKNYYYNAGLLKKYIIYTLKKSDKVICLSNEWLEFYSKELNLKNVIVLPNPVDTHVKTLFDYNKEKINLLFLGKVCKEKGIFDLIEFLKTNVWFQKNYIGLTIAGNGEIQKLLHIINNENLSEHIQYIGWIKAEEKNRVIQEADIYILPSYFEGVPISILECMSAGKPIIATKVGGVPSIVEANENGWLFEPGKFEQLNKIFDEIFSSKKLITKYGENSWIKAQKYKPEAIIQKLLTIYSEMLPLQSSVKEEVKNYFL
ncbi:glycosyltransferase family 4 protein [Hydrotalea sandarakina]|jgi:glycosyltransferase involved in cell wall biosynthesis|uniref:Glycosyltransferase involved in cell wall biosynthesis n=1 Tax=Hydrotalea sandarakina TaxID=1004304 RepID=A0A2W7SCK2_9BACT|nr:glycosyltransferase family 4 protein [Hydrotalea sandarakina]PZX64697.1 glycosyltransferase involved in cell wall biosynthesis [Hydrotalea sandarakina]